MAKKTRKNPPPPAPLTPDGLAGRAREVWLAGLGALDRARKRGAEGFETLAERGAQVRAGADESARAALDGLETALRALAERPREVAGWAAGTAADALEGAVEAALDGLGVARSDDVEKLRADLRTLDARLARLSGAPPAVATFHLRPHGDAWAVLRDGAREPLAVAETKKRALAEARRRARAAAPSRLLVRKRDGTEEVLVTYDG